MTESKKTAAHSAMEELHALLAQSLSASVVFQRKVIPAEYNPDGTLKSPEREELVPPSPAALAVAAKFLKDNSIFSTPEQSGAVGELRDRIRQRKTSRRASAQDVNDALATIGRDLLQ